MKRLLIAASCLALVACNNSATDEVLEEVAPVSQLADAEAAAGMYESTSVEGKISYTQINADGTYSDMDSEMTETDTGTWEVKDGKSCFTPAEGEESCFTDGETKPDGGFTATNDDGTIVMVRKLEATDAEGEVPAEEAPAAE